MYRAGCECTSKRRTCVHIPAQANKAKLSLPCSALGKGSTVDLPACQKHEITENTRVLTDRRRCFIIISFQVSSRFITHPSSPSCVCYVYQKTAAEVSQEIGWSGGAILTRTRRYTHDALLSDYHNKRRSTRVPDPCSFTSVVYEFMMRAMFFDPRKVKRKDKN